jgi:pimeloyl-ACP methyl ester carboxylesterase
MRENERKALVPGSVPIWNAATREAAIAIAAELIGADSGTFNEVVAELSLPEADRALFADPVYAEALPRNVREMFAQGVVGYADDRLADGRGWDTFDVGAIACPVAVIHGGRDSMALVGNAHHTAAIVPGATLRIFEPLGHFSICREALPVVSELLSRAAAGTGGRMGARA